MIFEKIQLEPDEKILRIVRKHWFKIFRQSFVMCVIVLVPPIVLIGLLSVSYAFIEPLVITYLAYILFLYAFWTLICWMLFASIITNYYLNMWCITNKRVIKIDQVSLFNRQTGSFRLERLQDVTVGVKGIIATLLDFGTVHVETASENASEFESRYMPRPQEVKALILEAADAQMQHTQSAVQLDAVQR